MQRSTNQKGVFFRAFPVLTMVFLVFIYSCTKQETFKQNTIAESSASQNSYLAKINNALKDTLSTKDFSSIDFSKVYKSKDARSKNFFLRLSIKNKKLADDFILLKTDSSGSIITGKIIHVQKNKNGLSAADITLITNSLDRQTTSYLKNATGNAPGMSKTSNYNKVSGHDVSSFMEQEEEPVGEQTLPDVVVTGYIYDYSVSYFWYCYDDILGGGGGGGGAYTYGAAEGGGNGGYGAVSDDEIIVISYEAEDYSPIDIDKYIKCFSTLSNTGAQFKITILTDLPVNSDPNQLFDWTTGACGHTFLQLTKSSGSTIIQQNIGFYPSSGWKSIEANSPVASKLVDNAGHEYNASLSVTVDATHFQTALNEVQYYGKSRYDIDNFNCTDFALNVFNAASPELLSIPQYHIPGGMYGELSNTPQGLYNELLSLSKGGGYSGGQISVPGIAGYTGSSHGACN